ncbi:hypothetical protein ACSX1A_05945 [Pontibacter sp. MBLB2868]|uniref:hypothetical protein n=1 Tax=Pontibacter sp. MBLB2868 TaxID=3451555 RepID=UPI003F74EF88
MKKRKTETALLIGIGNAARQDDGLGWAFVERVEQEGLFKGDLLFRFQLNLEDAELISKYKQVIFVDAHKREIPNGFMFERCVPDAGAGFSTHQLPPKAQFICASNYMSSCQRPGYLEYRGMPGS